MSLRLDWAWDCDIGMKRVMVIERYGIGREEAG